MFARFNDIRARRARGEAGFSLIELLVVVVIMGILIAIAVPVYLNYQNGAKKKSLEADVRNAVPAVEQCIADHNGSWNDDCADNAKIGLHVSADNKVTISKTGVPYTITGERADPAWFVVYDSSQGKSGSADTEAGATPSADETEEG